MFIGALMLLTACASRQDSQSKASETGAVAQSRPFGGLAPVSLPAEAHAMGDFLKAQLAASDNDQAEALRAYEATVKADPNNAELRVKLATLYVRQSRLKDALEQVQQAIALDPGSTDARLLAAGISSATGDNAAAEQHFRATV